MDESFSLNFNPISNIKTIKEYEIEIEKLKNENFELKHQISHYKNIPNQTIDGGQIDTELKKLLMDAKRSIAILEKEKKDLQDNFEAEKREMLDRLGFLENENAKLIKHLENTNECNSRLLNDNKNLSEYIYKQKESYEEQNKITENILSENKKLKEEVRQETELNERIKLEFGKEREAYQQEYNKEISMNVGSLQNQINQLLNEKKVSEKIISEKENLLIESTKERERLLNEIKRLADEANKQIMFLSQEKEQNIKEFNNKFSLNNEERNRLFREISRLKEEVQRYDGLFAVKDNEIKNLKEVNFYKEKEFEENKHKENKIYQLNDSIFNFCKNNVLTKIKDLNKGLKLIEDKANELNLKFKRKRFLEKKNINKKINKIKNDSNYQLEKYLNEINKVNEKLKIEEKKLFISEKNVNFLKIFEIHGNYNMEDVVSRFNNVYSELVNKLKIMEKEVGEITYFAENNKNMLHGRTLKLLDEFTLEFEKARKELDTCRKYLEKKGKENKELKSEKTNFESKILFLQRRFEETKERNKVIKQSYDEILSKLKKKEELISRLEMKINAHY